MSRQDEIWRLNQLGADELAASAQDHLVVLPDADSVDKHLARAIADTVRDKPNAVLILPCWPTTIWPPLCELINRKQISLRKARFFFMTEYADKAGSAVADFHPLSCRGGMNWLWQQVDSEFRPAEESICFPDQFNLEDIPAQIKKAGGADVCFATIGLDGHIGFNEPEPNVRDLGCRLARLNDFTVTMKAIASEVGGDIVNFPRQAFTLGLRECFSARRVRLYCRSEVRGLQAARTVLRLAVLGQSGDDCPVTWIRGHPDWQVITDRGTAEPPKHVL